MKNKIFKSDNECNLNGITVSNGSRYTQKHILISREWATEDYYTITDDGYSLLIKKCYMEIPKSAIKLSKGSRFSIENSDIENGKYVFDIEESDEDKVIVYYK